MLSVPFRTILRLRGMDLPSSFRVYIGRVNLYKPYPHPGLRICSGKRKEKQKVFTLAKRRNLMAKSLEQYKEEICDQPALVCVVCSASITVERAYAVHLQLVKGLHGLQLHQIRVSDIDANHGGLCAACVPWVEKRGGTVFPLTHTIEFLAEARQGADERIARKAAEAAERKKLEEEREAREEKAKKREASILANFDFGQSVAAPANRNHANQTGAARKRMVEAGLVTPANTTTPILRVVANR